MLLQIKISEHNKDIISRFVNGEGYAEIPEAIISETAEAIAKGVMCSDLKGGDAISRIDLRNSIKELPEWHGDDAYYCGLNDACRCIEKAAPLNISKFYSKYGDGSRPHYEILPVVCDYGLYRVFTVNGQVSGKELIEIFNSSSNAELVKRILEADNRHEKYILSNDSIDQLCRLRSDLKTGVMVGSTLRTQEQIDKFIKTIDVILENNGKINQEAGTNGK